MNRPGKGLEAAVGRSLEKAGAIYLHNSNGHPACDWTASMDRYDPRLMVECKEIHEQNFRFSLISVEERKQLTRWALAGDMGVLVIRRVVTRMVRITVVCEWLDWLEHVEAPRGYDPSPILPLDDAPRPRRKSGSASLPIGLPGAPECLLEVVDDGRLLDLKDAVRWLMGRVRPHSMIYGHLWKRHSEGLPLFPQPKSSSVAAEDVSGCAAGKPGCEDRNNCARAQNLAMPGADL